MITRRKLLLLLPLAAAVCAYILYTSLTRAPPEPPPPSLPPPLAPPPIVTCGSVPAFQQVWGNFRADWGGAEAAIFTPFYITPGGGEKYMLSAVQALQSAGYFVTVYTRQGNKCTKAQLLATATALRVDLQPDKLAMQLWHRSVPRVRVFFVLGNDKWPPVPNIGAVGFFMCQFPFDLGEGPVLTDDVPNLRSFDHVLVNSRFSFKWYNTYLAPTIEQWHKDMEVWPSVDVLHPPCSTLDYDPTSDTQQRHNIVMLGRFFDGRQSKGHAHAIELFAKLVPSLPTTTRLILVGQLVRDHEAYLKAMRKMVSDLGLSARIEFAVSVSPDAVAAHLRSSLVQWHMTGLEVDMDKDPASREHFGISIVECMSTGTIPIALHGGPDDIIEHGIDGFLSYTADDIGRHTLHMFAADAPAVAAMRHAAVSKSKTFSYDSFRDRFLFYMHRGLFTRPFRHFVAAALPSVRKCAAVEAAAESPMAAMIIEGRNHYALEYVIYNTMSILHKSTHKWTLHLYHTSLNLNLVRRIVQAQGLSNTILHELPTTILDVANYNQYMKSEDLWKSLGQATKVLLFQTDALIVNPGIERFLKFDYVGAPWHQQNERWSSIVQSVPIAVGNGGFSLRSVSVMRRIASAFGNQSEFKEQEDIFYAKHVFKEHLLSQRQTAYDFCLEVPCDDLRLPPSGPFAVHAAWYYNPIDSVQELLYHSLQSTVCDDCLADSRRRLARTL